MKRAHNHLKFFLLPALILCMTLSESLSTLSAQCDTEVSGVFTYCNAVGTPGTTGYFVAFRVKDLTGDTLNVVDLDGNNVTNRGKRINDINNEVEPATVTIVPLQISGVGADTLEFWYFGPYTNGSTFNIALVDPSNVCDTIFIASGNYDCMDNSGISDPGACDAIVPLYFLDFSQTEFDYGGGGGGNESFDEIFLIMQRSREEMCCDLQPANQRCFEFIVRLGDQDVGLAIDDVGSGATAGEFYADTLNMFDCSGPPDETWPFTVAGGQSSDLPLCLEGGAGQEFIVLSCKSGANVTGASVDAISSIFAPPEATIEPCNVFLEVFNVDSAFWSSPDDPNLDNFISCSGDSSFCTFFYDTLLFGQVMECAGDTFVYIVGGIPADNECIVGDTILYDTTYVIVYPMFEVSIDTMCHPSGDSLILTATISSSATGCDYDFNWSTGDTTQSITVPFSDTEYFVTVTRGDLDTAAQNCVLAVDSIVTGATVSVDCSNITDTLYTCISQIPDPDTSLVIIGGCGVDPLIYSQETNNGGSGCVGDSLIITRLYIIDFDADTVTTTTDRDTCGQLLIVVDDVAPAITCPSDVTVDCAGMVPAPNTASVITSDNCGGSVVVTHTGDTVTNMLCPNQFTIIRTYMASDACGNTSTCAQIIIVFDDTPPSIVCPSDITIECLDSTLPANTGSATGSDNCGGSPTIGFADGAISGSCPSSFIRTWTATDSCGNTAQCAQTISINDNTPPVITCPANVTIECDESTLPADTGTATATDACDTAVLVVSSDITIAGGCPQEYTINRTWIATDDCGNSSSCLQVIVVDDSTPPTITCPADITVECSVDVPAPNTGSVTASDNCGIAVIGFISDVTVNVICDNQYTINRTYQASDGCGNTANCVQVIMVFDDTPPSITCPQDITVECASQVPAANTGSVTSTDNCLGTPVVTHTGDVITNMTCANQFTITRTYQSTDVCGNSSTCAQIITVFDDAPPSITCPPDITIECLDSTLPANTGTATATDNCAGTPVVDFSDSAISGACPSFFTRTWTATDACGNTAQCSQIIYIDDNTPPVITCPANVTIECDESSLPADTGIGTATDACDTAVLVVSSDITIAGGCPQEYTINRTWVATDDCGNSSSCLQVIVVDDSTPPTITCPGDITVECSADVPAPNTGSVTASDNCGIAVIGFISDVTVNVICDNQYTINRTYQASDGCGNTASCLQVITVFDDTPPAITCPQDITVECASQVPAASTASVTSTDNCPGTPVVTHAGDVITNMTCANQFTITRTYQSTDVCGNSATCAQIITVFDDVPPSITCPPDITIECLDSTLPANTGTATSSDNCAGTPVVDFLDSAISGTCPSSFTRTWTATDACGNTAQCIQSITIDDNTPPSITCPANVTVDCDESTLPADTGIATATDACDTAVLVVSSDITIAGGCPQEYTINRTWVATDDCGNSSSCLQVIVVDDSTPPTITCPADITVECSTDVPAPDTGSVTASDNCGIAVIGFISDVTVNVICDNQYTINRTYQASDGCGNTASCVQVITVFDDTPPVITCPDDVTLACAANVPPADPGSLPTSDNCTGAVIVTSTDVVTDSTCVNRLTISRIYLATDVCGNTATCVQTITVFDNVAPTLTCPDDVTVSCASNVPPSNTGNIPASDNCNGTVTVTSSDVVTSMTCANSFTITRTYIATDVCGNTASCNQIITVADDLPPTITCPADVTVQCANEVPPANPGGITGSDNCGGVVTITVAPDVISNMSCANRFTITRVYTATDVCGNSATCAQTIIVFDDTLPSITCPEDVTVSCANEVPPVNTGSVVSSDNCGGSVTVTHLGDVTTNQTCANSFTVTRTYQASDVCGNSATCAQIITVNDLVPPSITCPEDITIDSEESTDPSNTGLPTASDNCGETPVLTFNDVTIEGECEFEFNIERTWTATDACGNTATCLQVIDLEGGCVVDLSLTKVLNAGQGTVSGGDDVTFTITVFNEGEVPIGSVTIIDYIPLGFSLNDPDWTAGTTGSTGQSATITLSTGNGGLPPGGLLPAQNVAVEITLLADDDILPGEYVNIAEISVVFDLAGNDVTNDDIDSDPDEDDLNDPDDEDDHDLALICVLPVPVIAGDNYVCPGDTTTYSVENFNPANSYNWILQNGGGVIIDETDSTITIVWQDQPGGAFVLQLDEVAGAGCEATVLLLIFIQGDEVLACNDHVYISIDEDCESVILSGVILEGELYGDDNYVVIIIDQNGDTIPNATVTAEHVGQTFTVKVLSECNGQSCWGTITVEDKLPPQIICECPVGGTADPECEITCLDVAQLVEGNIPPDLQPEVTDNCGNATIEIIDTELNFDNCAGGYIRVTWKATDIAGNMATCEQEFTIIPLTLDSLVFPDNYEGECGSSVHPDITGWPQIDGIDLNDDNGLCNIFAGYWDKELSECGGGRKIVRTWTVLDWCTVEIVEGQQIIKLTDTEPPVLTCPSNLTVGTDFWYCYANVSVPRPVAYDNCSDIVSFSLYSATGEIISYGNNVVIHGLPLGSHIVVWTVSDECGNSSTCSMTITVIDNVVPVANCDEHTIISLTNDGPSGITLVPATVFDDGSYDNCGPVTFRARRMDSCIDFDWTTEGACEDHIPGGIPPVNSRDRGTIHRSCVPFACCDVGAGPIMVELEVTDASGNVNYCMVEATVQDKISPFVECPPDIIVSCDFWFPVEEGTFIDAEGNNDGSLDEDPLSGIFGNMLDAFRYHENDRNSIIINDPGNEQLFQPHFWGFDGWADDNCEVNLQVRVRVFDDCSGQDLPSNAPPGAVKLIERRFSASGGEDGVAPGTCTQRIWVVDFDPFYITDINCNNNNPNDGVIWPCDLLITDCPESLENLPGPVIFDDACSLIGVAFEDTRFDFVDGACFKILRRWAVIDWCQYDPATGEGLWYYTQVIKVHDEEGPEFTECPSGPQVLCVADAGVTLPDNNQAFLGESNPLSSSCSAHLNLCQVVHETCSDYVKFDVKIYLFNSHEFVQVAPVTTVPVDSNNHATLCFDTRESSVQSIRLNGIPYNSPWCGNYHRIVWSVEDGCGNWSHCEYLFRLEDCKQPSPVCINGLSTVVMPSSGQVTIWAKDFNASSFDDCTPAEELLYSFSGDSYQPSFTYTCDNVPAFGVELSTQIWVADGGVDHNCNGQIEWSERNKDFCTTTIVIMDNEDACDTIGSILAGEILTPHAHAINHVLISLTSAHYQFPDHVTGMDGNYIIHDVPPGQDYIIGAERDDNHKNGVSTLDLVRIQKHLLGRELFNSPYQYIAADANNNQQVSAIDLIELRKLILGIYTKLPNNKSWRFMDKKFVIEDPTSPWPFQEHINIPQFQSSMMDNDFIGIKIGDVNNTVQANAAQLVPRNGRRVLQVFTDMKRWVEAGEEVEIGLRISHPVTGFQWTLETDGLEWMGIRSDDILIGEEHIGLIKDGVVTMSWNGEDSGRENEGEMVIYLKWKAAISGRPADMIRMSNLVTDAEAYLPDGEILDVRLVTEDDEGAGYALHQNEPNPWGEATTIGFELPESADVQLTLYDLTGKVVRVLNGSFKAGYNTWMLTAKDLPMTGILYYRLESGEFSATKKMVVIR